MTQLNTKLVHGVPVTDNATGAVNPPIYNSSTYAFESVGSMPRWDYARSGNPTRDFLERQIAQLEHGVRGFAFASGLAAIHAVLSIFRTGRAHCGRLEHLRRHLLAVQRAFQPLGARQLPGGHTGPARAGACDRRTRRAGPRRRRSISRRSRTRCCRSTTCTPSPRSRTSTAPS